MHDPQGTQGENDPFAEFVDGETVFDAVDAATFEYEFIDSDPNEILGDEEESEAELEDDRNLDLLLDVQIPISVEVGRSQMSLDKILDLVPGSVITMDKKAEEPVDLRVNGKLVARGEVVLVDDVYGIRITQIVAEKTP